MRQFLHVTVTVTVLLTLSTRITAQWQAGVSRGIITPNQLMWMSGYASRDRPAEGTLTDLWAKVLVLEDENRQRAALITLDLIGIDRALATSICNELQSQHGLQRHQIAICCSHTHTGPVVARNLRPMHFELLEPQQRQLINDYADRLEQTVVRLVGQAIGNRGPAVLLSGVGTAGFAVNRRNNPERDVPELRAAKQLSGPVDHDVPVLIVQKAGETKAVVFGYACHATVLSSYEWSGDYPGFAQIAIEKANPGCTAMFWAGCGADQNPLPRRSVQLAQSYGTALAQSVQTVLAQELTQLSGKMRQSYREVDLPLDDLPSAKQLRQDAGASDRYVAARAKMLLRQIDAGIPLSATYPFPVALWRLGDQVTLVFLGGEVVVDYALRVKSAFPGAWVAGYSNDVMAYIPSRRVWLEGGYEGAGAMVYYGLPARWAPDVETLILDEVRRQMTNSKD